jgi:hypothetical protein
MYCLCDLKTYTKAPLYGLASSLNLKDFEWRNSRAAYDNFPRQHQMHHKNARFFYLALLPIKNEMKHVRKNFTHCTTMNH